MAPEEAIQQKPKAICLKMFPAMLAKQKTEKREKKISIQWAILAIYSVESNDVVNSMGKGLWCKVDSTSHCVPWRMTHGNNFSWSQCQETVFLQGSCLAFIWSSTYLSADHVSLLALTVGKLQIKFMAHHSRPYDRNFDISTLPGFIFFPSSQTLFCLLIILYCMLYLSTIEEKYFWSRMG